MNKVEIRSFLRSVVLFFGSLAILIFILQNHIYHDKVQSHQDSLYSQMQIASLNLESHIFTISFTPKSKEKVLYKMLRDKDSLYGYFEIYGSKKYFTKVSYPLSSFHKDIDLIKAENREQIIQSLVIAFILSILFSLYALYPLKQSLQMTNEFVKDILHDFNTPISTIRLNLDLLPEGKSKAKTRIATAVKTILNLQKNLKDYIDEDLGEVEVFDIKSMVEERVDSLCGSYPNLHFSVNVAPLQLKTHKDAMVRIFDNILSNACKYNTKGGEVIISLEGNLLSVKDTGIGIKHPGRVFDRFYKETSRGLGIGLHIVDKLSRKMDIGIKVESKVGQGSRFTLDLSKVLAQDV